MKRLVSILLMSVLFISVLSFNSNEAKAVSTVNYLTTTKTALKASTSSKSKTLVIIKKGVKLQSNYKKGNWTQIVYKSKTGWVTNKTLKKYTAGKGKVNGVITWQYNEYVGTKADVGADVVAFPIGGFKKIKIEDVYSATISNSFANKNGLYSTEVNGFGNYSLTLPEGQYYILIKSAKTTRNPDEPVSSYVKSVMKKYSTNFKNDSILGLHIYNHMIEKVTIKKGVTVDISNDWGYTYF